MALASTSVHVIEQAPKDSCASVCVRRTSCNCLLPHQETPRSDGGSDSGSFQITASGLSPGVCEFVCISKSGVSVSHSPLALPEVSPAGL